MALRNPVAVIKIGGDVLLDESQWRGLAENVQYLHQQGWHCVLLHGGGPQVNELQTRLGLIPNKVAGRRITSEADLLCVIQAIAGQVNVDLCNRLQLYDLPVLGIHGSTGVIQASKRPPVPVTGVDGLVDFGAVGDVQTINTDLLNRLLENCFIPVIATLARDEQGALYNINADTTVVAIAKALQADLLCMVTGVGGVYENIDQPDTLITAINHDIANELITREVVKDGMIAKIEEALSVVSDGIKQVVITSMARQGNMQQLLTDPDNYAMGTRIIPN